MDLKRLQELAGALGCSIWTRPEGCRDKDWPVSRNFQLFDKPSGAGGSVLAYGATLAPIREKLEAEYRKLAIEVDRLWLLRYKAEGKVPCYEHSFGYDTFTAIADELAAMKEPTMVERLEEVRHKDKIIGRDPFASMILDALIELYKAKESA